jgi:hypothetical protein
LDDKLAAIAQAISPPTTSPKNLNQPSSGKDETPTPPSDPGNLDPSQAFKQATPASADFQFNNQFKDFSNFNSFNQAAFNTANNVKSEPNFPSGSSGSVADRHTPEEIDDPTSPDPDLAAGSAEIPESASEPAPPEPIAWEVWAYLERQRKDTLRHVKTFESEWQANRFLEQAERERKAGLRVHYEIRPIFAPEAEEVEEFSESEDADQKQSNNDRFDPVDYENLNKNRGNQPGQNAHNDQDPEDAPEDAIDVEVISEPAPDDHSNTDVVEAEITTSKTPTAKSDRVKVPKPPEPQAYVDVEIKAAESKTKNKAAAAPKTAKPANINTNLNPDASLEAEPSLELELPTPPMSQPEYPPKYKPKYQSEPQAAIYTNIDRPFRAAQNFPDLEPDLELELESEQAATDKKTPDRLSEAELAQRLEVSNNALDRHKLTPGFGEWCQKQPKRKPRGEVWQYDPSEDLFYRLD